MKVNSASNPQSSPYAGLTNALNGNKSKKSSIKKVDSDGQKQIEAIQKQIEAKKKQLSDINSNEKLSEETKKMKRETIEGQIKELEQQLTTAQMEQQKKAIELNNDDENKKNNNTQETQEERFTKTVTEIAGKMDSIQSSKQLKAQLTRDKTRLSIEMDEDSQGGYISNHKSNELSKMEKGISSLASDINTKTGEINKEIENNVEVETKKAKDTEDKDKKDSEKIDEKNNKNSETDSENITQKKNISQTYVNNSFDNYKKQEEHNIYNLVR